MGEDQKEAVSRPGLSPLNALKNGRFAELRRRLFVHPPDAMGGAVNARCRGGTDLR